MLIYFSKLRFFTCFCLVSTVPENVEIGSRFKCSFAKANSEMIDSHIHLIPAIDDGAADFGVAHDMVKIASEDGIKAIICTPHDLNAVYQNKRTKILNHLNELRRFFEEKEIPMVLHPGAELHIDPDLVGKVMTGEALTLADRGKHVLVEFPKMFIPRHVESILENLLYNKFTPVIAHPERNPVIIQTPQLLNEWLNWGCKSQLTAMSVTGEFGRSIQSICKDWCLQGLVHLVASDAHRPTGRAPKLAAAYTQVSDWIGTDSANILFAINPQCIIEANELLSLPAKTHARQKINARAKWYKNIFR